MFLLISVIEEIRYCCYFPGYYCAVAALCRATILQNRCHKHHYSRELTASCFCNIMQGINSNHTYRLIGIKWVVCVNS